MKRIVRKLLAAVAAGMLMIGGFAAQASADVDVPVPPEGSAVDGGNIWREGCTFYVQAELPEAGDYRLEIWDDEDLLVTQDRENTAPNNIQTFQFVITTELKEEFPGIGIFLNKLDDDGKPSDVVISENNWGEDDEGLKWVMAACAYSDGESDELPDARVLVDVVGGVVFEVVVPWGCAADEVRVGVLDAAVAARLLGPDYDAASAALYDINLFDEDGKPVAGCEAPMVLRVTAPTAFDEFVLVGDDGVEKLEYKLEDGMVVVQVEHFSVYGFVKRAAAKVPDKKPAPKPVMPKTGV